MMHGGPRSTLAHSVPARTTVFALDQSSAMELPRTADQVNRVTRDYPDATVGDDIDI
jgi:hypothetical protein